jgi:hypothetical protein
MLHAALPPASADGAGVGLVGVVGVVGALGDEPLVGAGVVFPERVALPASSPVPGSSAGFGCAGGRVQATAVAKPANVTKAESGRSVRIVVGCPSTGRTAREPRENGVTRRASAEPSPNQSG